MARRFPPPCLQEEPRRHTEITFWPAHGRSILYTSTESVKPSFFFFSLPPWTSRGLFLTVEDLVAGQHAFVALAPRLPCGWSWRRSVELVLLYDVFLGLDGGLVTPRRSFSGDVCPLRAHFYSLPECRSCSGRRAVTVLLSFASP